MALDIESAPETAGHEGPVLRLQSAAARRLADLMLIIWDIDRCLAILDLIDLHPRVGLILGRDALLEAFIIKFSSCFKSTKSRSHLDPSYVFRSHEGFLDAYKRLDAVRDNHVAHDLNSMQVMIPVALTDSGPEFRLKDIQGFTVKVSLLEAVGYPDLRPIADRAREFAAATYEKQKQHVASEFIAMTSLEKSKLKPFSSVPIELGDLHQPRGR